MNRPFFWEPDAGRRLKLYFRASGHKAIKEVRLRLIKLMHNRMLMRKDREMEGRDEAIELPRCGYFTVDETPPSALDDLFVRLRIEHYNLMQADEWRRQFEIEEERRRYQLQCENQTRLRYPKLPQISSARPGQLVDIYLGSRTTWSKPDAEGIVAHTTKIAGMKVAWIVGHGWVPFTHIEDKK